MILVPFFQSLLKLKLVEPILNVVFPIMCEPIEEDDVEDMEAEASTAPQFASQVSVTHKEA